MTVRRARAALVALAALAAGTAGPAIAQTDPPGGGAPPSIRLVDRPPWLQPEDRGSFLVSTGGDVEGATVTVEVFSAMDSVDDLDRSAAEDVGVRLSLSPRVPVGFLAPGPEGTHVVGLPVSADPDDNVTTQLVAPGVHPVVISLFDAAGALVDEIRTPIVRLGDEDDPWAAPDLAILLDVEAPPTLRPDGSREIPAPLLERMARVGDVLATHPDLELTVAAVPDTLEALGTMQDPLAAGLLDRIAGQDVLASPYVPLPVDALVRSDLDRLVGPLVERGETVLADRVGAAPRPGIWAGTGEVGPAGGALLSELGFRRLLVPAPDAAAGAGGGDEPAPLVDSGPRPLERAGPLLGIAVDTALSADLASPLDDDADAAHVALARLLLRSVEAGPGDADEPTTVLVRPGPLAERSALAGLLDLLDDPAAPVRVGGLDLVDDRPDADAEVLEPGSVVRTDLREVGERADAAWAALDTFASLTGSGSPRADGLRLQVATAIATTTPTPARRAALDEVEGSLATAFGGIRLSGQTDLNLTSRQGTLPVTIENANPFPVEVVIRIRSDRLAFPAGEVLPVTVDDDISRIDVPVEALATGSVPVFVELWTPGDGMRLDARQLNVRSTAFSGVGLVISLGALVVLVVWWARTWRSASRSRRSA